MARTVSIGTQNFEKIIINDCFYIDKTHFIKEWWESNDEVTLITRPRRFGKTLNMNMLERFWSIKYQGQGDIFENLKIWQEKNTRNYRAPILLFLFHLQVSKQIITQTLLIRFSILLKIYIRSIVI